MASVPASGRYATKKASMLTSRGWLFLVTILGVTAVALAIGNSLLALVGLTLLSWFLATWLFFVVCLRLAIPKLSVEREVRDATGPVDSMWAGQTFAIQARLCSASALVLPYVRIHDRVPRVLERKSGSDRNAGPVSAKQALEASYAVTCPVPARIRFDGLSLQVTDLQGFFLYHHFVRKETSYRVLPALTDARGRIPAVKQHNMLPLLGHHQHRRPGTGSELLDLRDYLPGDPPKTIAWKASARRGRLMTKEFDSEVPIRCTLFVDTSNSVRIGGGGKNALGRIINIASAVAQANTAARDLTGLCSFDDRQIHYVRPARGQRHLIHLFQLLADAAGHPPDAAEVAVNQLLPLAYGLAQEVYPDCLGQDVNAMPKWLSWWAPQPAYTIRRPPIVARSWWTYPWAWLRRLLRHGYYTLEQALAVRFSRRYHRHYRWRKHLAAILSVRHGLGPGGLATLLEDDDLCSRHLQRFLNDHQVPVPLPLYDSQGRYLFAAPRKIEVLAGAFLRAVARGRDNELFVILADLLELDDHIGKLLAAIKAALARHHQVMVVCPWPADIPMPKKRKKEAGIKSQESGVRSQGSGFELLDPESTTVQALLRRATVVRFHRAYYDLRRSFARFGVRVLCAKSEDSVPLILNRLERLRILERGMA
jgi:uncharacterized protein (DUF58 family)